MEQAEDAVVTASGMAAISAVLFAHAKQGARWGVSNVLYGMTYSLLVNDISRMGVKIEWFDPTRPETLRELVSKGGKFDLLYFETISNPIARLAALPEIVDIARQSNSITVVDNTFASPWNVCPIPLGVDFVVESGTKYLNGHTDIICGMVAAKKETLLPVWRQMTRLGGCLDPDPAYLWDRGLRTFPLRIIQATANAKALADWLKTRSDIEAVFYPGVSEPLPDWLPEGGAVLSFRVMRGDAHADSVLRHLKVVKAATSLGGVETLASNPYNTSHVQFTSEQRAEMGILPGTIRLAVGTEALADLKSDLEQAIISTDEC